MLYHRFKILILLLTVSMSFSVQLNAQCAQGMVILNGFTADGGQGTYNDPATGKVTINFCFKLNKFFEASTNWAHGIYLDWDNLPAGSKVLMGSTGAQPAQHGSRNWIFLDSIKASDFGLPGPGFYVDEGDGNPKNNYGDNGIGTPNATFPDLKPFCFTIVINCGSTPPIAFVPKITVTGDGTTGGWSNKACDGDEFRALDGGPNGNGAVVVCGVVLPVKLLSFSGEYSKQGNLIKWLASSDHLFSHFELEKRQESSVAFELLSLVEVRKGSTGGSNEIFSYSFLDQTKDPLSYYRLKMLEKDGTYKYSPIISIKQNTRTVTGNKFSVYPNPATEVVVIQSETETRYGTLTVNVYSALGKKIAHHKFTAEQQYDDYILDLNSYSNGLYFLEIMNGSVALETLNFIKY